MPHKEIRLDYDKISDPQTITDVQERAFREHGLDMHRDELTGEEIVNDSDRKQRILKVRSPKKFFDMGRKR